MLTEMGYLRTIIAALGRICLSTIFLASGVNKLIDWKETEKQFINTIGEWQSYLTASNIVYPFLHVVVIWSPLILMVATCIEILGALLLFCGFKERFGAFLLILFLIPMTFLMQHFWFTEGHQRELQLSLFLRDCAILGGLLIVLLHGGHGKSLLIE